ncbi:MAG: hypothetical protein AUH85_18560 [Chloroflexi bacterium 13_1_40CM_4_68_4]|nr:MAG: hypothetical protein AUH85_18560 [Chloroflexi bacterium 13_1_40CM_4_68_4]
MSAELAPEQVAALLESTCALLEAEIGALGEEESRWHPAPGEWCANEVLGHLVEAERRGFNGRIRLILSRDRPTFAPWDQVAVARERKDCDRMAESLWMEFLGIRHDSLALVRSLRPADLERGGTHGKVGWLRVKDLLHEWVHHDRNHTRQMLANVQGRVWPHMANAQKFAGE